MTRAAWLVALAACGDGIAAPDAFTVDADGERGIVSVHVLAIDIFRPTSVYFQERDSTLALATTLDGDGWARGYLRPHGYVTVVPSVVGGVTPFYTYANVSPGDELVIDPGQLLKGGAEIMLRIPSAPNTAFYSLETACGITDVSGAQNAAVRVDMTGCGTKTDVLVIAHTPTGEQYIYKSDVELSESGPAAVNVIGPYRPFETSSVTIVGIPPGEDRWFVDKGITIGKTALHMMGEVYDVAGDLEVSTTGPTPPEATMLVTTGPGTSTGLEFVIDWKPASLTSTIDVASHDLRDQTERAHYVPEARSIVWSEAATGVRPDVTLARMQWSAPETLYQWTVLAKRGDEAKLDLPVLPRAELTPDPHSPPYDMYRISMIGGAADAVDSLLGWTPSLRWPVEGDSGTVVWQSLAQ